MSVLVQTIGDLLPAAAGVALSPIPIIAVILILGTPKARSNGPAFAIGWVVGLTAVSVIVIVVAGGSDDAGSTAATGVNWFQVAVGVLFLALAAKQWRSRPAPGETAELPAWMHKVDEIAPKQALLLGLGLSAANPKNLALTMAASATIAQSGMAAGDDLVAVLVFVVLGSITVAGAVVYYFTATERASAALGTVKDFMSAHNAVIMMVILLILGLKILGQGLGALAA